MVKSRPFYCKSGSFFTSGEFSPNRSWLWARPTHPIANGYARFESDDHADSYACIIIIF